MINTHTEEQAALYVLDLLEDEERSVFEAQLESDPEVAALVRDLSIGLHAPIKQVAGPERLDLLDGIHARIGVPDADQSGARVSIPAGRVRFPWLYVWAAAASLLLFLNLFLVTMLTREPASLTGPSVAESTPSASDLMEENRILKAFNDSWEQEYLHLASRMLPFFESRDGVGRFTVIDLSDARGFNRSGPGQGFDDLAEYFLRQSPAPGPGGKKGATFASVELAEKAVPGNKSATVGYAVWRDDEQRGYMDLYNLPPAPGGQEPFLWVLASGSSDYMPVGFLPALENGTGSFSFTLDQSEFPPEEILITAEAETGPGPRPSANHLMVGP